MTDGGIPKLFSNCLSNCQVFCGVFVPIRNKRACFSFDFTRKPDRPPVAIFIFIDCSMYLLHLSAFSRNASPKVKEISADIRKGTQRDAILFSVGSNAEHGLRRSNSDKRRAVETLLNDPEWSKKSARWIADVCHVSQPFVSGIRNHSTSNIISCGVESRDGKTRNTTNIGKTKQAETPEVTSDFDMSDEDEDILEPINTQAEHPITKDRLVHVIVMFVISTKTVQTYLNYNPAFLSPVGRPCPGCSPM